MPLEVGTGPRTLWLPLSWNTQGCFLCLGLSDPHYNPASFVAGQRPLAEGFLPGQGLPMTPAHSVAWMDNVICLLRSVRAECASALLSVSLLGLAWTHLLIPCGYMSEFTSADRFPWGFL